MDKKFKANPYNPNNRLIQSSDIINIMKYLNINNFKINDIKLYQTSFVHNSYTKLLSYNEYNNETILYRDYGKYSNLDCAQLNKLKCISFRWLLRLFLRIFDINARVMIVVICWIILDNNFIFILYLIITWLIAFAIAYYAILIQELSNCICDHS